MPLDLVEQIGRAGPTPPTARMAKVTAITVTPASVDVDYGGGVVPALKYLSSYTPTVGGVVVVLPVGGHHIVLGKTA